MKKKILFSLIAAIIIFIWQFLSHAFPNFHSSATEYTPKQNEILQNFEELGLKEGMYLLGQADPSKSHSEQEVEMKSYEDKPWAVVHYQNKMDMSMTMPMIRSILVDFVIAYLLFWLFLQQKEPTLKNRLFLSLALGMIVFFAVPYTNFIWFREPDIFAYFLDGIVPWLVLGFIGHKMAKE